MGFSPEKGKGRPCFSWKSRLSRAGGSCAGRKKPQRYARRGSQQRFAIGRSCYVHLSGLIDPPLPAAAAIAEDWTNAGVTNSAPCCTSLRRSSPTSSQQCGMASASRNSPRPSLRNKALGHSTMQDLNGSISLIVAANGCTSRVIIRYCSWAATAVVGAVVFLACRVCSIRGHALDASSACCLAKLFHVPYTRLARVEARQERRRQ
jgi:hypothetical protein